MKIKTKLYILFLVVAILFVIIGVIVDTTFDYTYKKIDISNDIEMMIKDTSELNFIANEYLMRHEERAQIQWYIKYNTLFKSIEKIEKKCIKPDQHRSIHKSIKKNHKRLGYLFSKLIAVSNVKNRPVQESQSRIDNAIYKEDIIADEIRMTFRLIMSKAFGLSASIKKQIKQTQQKIEMLIMLLIIGVVFFLFCLSMLTLRKLIRSINELVKGTEIIGAGDLGHRLDVKTNDEMGELAAAFNRMTEKRRQVEDALANVNSELEIRVRKRTAELVEANENLKQEISRRKQKEERIEHLNRVLLAIRSVNQIIVSTKDLQSLIQQICQVMIENRGYYNAWIILFDENKNPVATAEAGIGKDFSAMVKMFEENVPGVCGKNMLIESDVQVVKDPAVTCTGCPLARKYKGRSAMRIRLEHAGNVYGLLTASILKERAKDEEEQSLFEELALDIGLSLHSIKIEKKQKLIEEQLKASEERFKTLFELAPDAYYLMDTEGNFIDINKTAEKLTGYQKEMLVGKNFAEIGMLPDDQLPKAMEMLKKT